MKPIMMIKKERLWLAILALLTLMALLSPIPSVSAQGFRSCPPPYDATNYGSPLDLSYCDLSNADLSFADLTEADLNNADLRGANLTEANLFKADLSFVPMNGADLSNANLSRAFLYSSGLQNANLSKANLSKAALPYVSLIGANLTNADLNGADLTNAYLTNADLSGANLSNITWSNTTCPDGSNSSANTPETCFPPTDTTAPVITPNISGGPPDNGWYFNNVEVSWSVTDDESAVSSTSGCETTIIDYDTAGTTLTCTATSDGGTSSDSVTIKRDLSPLIMASNVSGTLGDGGWYISDVIVSWTLSDPESGIVSSHGCETQTFDYDTFGSDIICRAANGAGFQTETTLPGIRRDATSPIVSVTNVEDGASYILGSVPTVGCDTQDATSGVATNASLTITGGNPDGSGTFTATCDGATDFAGNMAAPASVSYTVEFPDNTPPMINANVSGTLGNLDWYVSDVSVSWAVSDDESAISSTNGCETMLINSDTAGMTLTCEASSGGGTAAESVTIQRDATAPTASASVSSAPNANGWYNSDATVSFSGSDDASGIASCDADVTLSSDAADQSASGTCTDNAGNVSATATAEGINIDKTAPVVSVTGVEDGATYILGSVPDAGCDTTDALSGVATVASLSLSGGNSNGVGSFTATCDGAVDNAGNTASASVSYSVIYEFGSFTGPIDPQAINQVKAGQTVPVKFSLNGDQGMAILAAGYPVSQEVGCDGSASINEVEETGSAGNSGLSYDSDSDQYSYNWKTDKGWSGACRQLIVQFDDGSEYSALFQFK